MNKAIVAVIVLGVVLALGMGYFFLKPPSSQNQNGQTGTNTGGLPGDIPYTPYPSGTSGSGQQDNGSSGSNSQGSNTPTVSVSSTVGGNIQIKDFRYSQGTKADSNNPGHYYLAGEDTTTAPYSIIYNNSDQSFVVSLLKEPIGPNRQDAEQKLLSILGISKAQACALRYWVGVPYSINQIYAGKNLGFSFCPGATQL